MGLNTWKFGRRSPLIFCCGGTIELTEWAGDRWFASGLASLFGQ